MVDDRKLDVLRAIVEDYVATEEPVGSKALVERHAVLAVEGGVQLVGPAIDHRLDPDFQRRGDHDRTRAPHRATPASTPIG